MRLSIGLVLCLIASNALADGWKFKDGRFPAGKVTVLELTRTQKTFLDLIRHCHDNRNTPFVFHLTQEQSAVLKREAGFSPTRFAVFESYRGDEEVDIEMNIINRFTSNEFEIPHQLLTPDDEAHAWEVSIIGWKPNPLEKDQAAIYSGKCPQ